MAQQQGPADEQVVSWCNQISTRDGTLTKDSRMINCFCEQTESGTALVKRAGTFYSPTRSIVTGTPQGIIGVGGTPSITAGYYIISDTIYAMGTGAVVSIALPSPTTPHLWCDTLSNVPLNQSISWIFNHFDLWKFTGGAATKVTDTNFVNSGPYVPGFTFLDGVFYVMTQTGKILGSSLNDGTVWPGLDFVQADYTFGGGSAIHRHLNYIIGFYQYGTQVYFDANAAPNGQGIALNPVPNAAWTTGSLPQVNTVELSDVTYFASQSEKFGRGVHTIQGLNLVKISTPFVDKILNNEIYSANPPYCNGIRVNGREFFLLTLPNQGFTLYYDTGSQIWGLWSSVISGVEQYFVGRFYGSDTTQDYMQDITTGRPIAFSPTIYTDATGNINVTSYTKPYDWNTLKYKRFDAMFQLSDTISTSIGVSFSDNDYASFSVARNINLSTVHKQLRNCGESRRRSWKMFHSDNTPLRLFDMKVDMIGLSR